MSIVSGKTARIAIAALLLMGAALLGVGTATVANAAECGVRTSDHRLHCGNYGGVDIMSRASYDPPSVYRDTLQTTFSWFDCWTTGDLHDGGNRTWYHTQGDIHLAFGYVPAAVVFTSSTFDANPTAYGLRHC